MDAVMDCSSPGCQDEAGTACQRCGRLHCLNHVFALHKPGLVEFYCRECIQGGPHAPRPVGFFSPPRAKPRQPQAMTFLAFCRLCEAEIYRMEHVRRRTKKVREREELEPKLAWTKHALIMRGMGGKTAYEHNLRHWGVKDRKTGELRLSGDILPYFIQKAWVGEDAYDPTLQVGDPKGPVVPENHRMLNVIKVLAGGIGYGVKRLSAVDEERLRRLYGAAWDDPDDPDLLDGMTATE